MCNDFLYIFINIFSLMMLTVFMALTLKNIKKQAALEMTILIGFCILWSVGSFAELQVDTLKSKVFWRNITQIAVFMVPFGVYIFVNAYIGEKNLLQKIISSILFIIQVTGIILIFTNDRYHLMREQVSLVEGSGIFNIVIKQTLLGKVLVSFNFIIPILAEIKLIIFMFRSSKSSYKQLISILAGIAFPTIFGVIKVAMPDAIAVRLPVSVAFIPGSIFLFWGMIRCNLLTLTPIARDKVFSVINEGIIFFSNEGKIIDANPKGKHFISDIFNLTEKNCENCMMESDYDELKTAVLNFTETTIDFNSEYMNKQKYYNIDLYPLGRKGINAMMIAIIRDVTEDREQKELLRIQAETDGLTKILNRISFVKYVEEQLNEESNRDKSLMMLMIDVDYFKQVNDTYGHRIGDYALIEIIKMVQQIVKETCLIGRLGGEEFGVFGVSYDKMQAFELAEAIRQKVNKQKMIFEENSFSVTLSIGISILSNIGTKKFDDLFMRADNALYKAKDEGRNRVVFSE